MNVGELFVTLELDTSQFNTGLSSAEGTAKSFGSALGPMLTAGALAAVAALGTALVGIGTVAFSAASEAEQGIRNLQAGLGITEEAARQLGDEAIEVFTNNFTGSIAEASSAIEEAARQLGDFVDPSELGELASGALAVSDVFGQDYPQVLNSARTLMDTFGLSGQQALDFIAKGNQEGLNTTGDLLDSIGEYSNLYAESGFSADQFFSSMHTGLQGGVLGTDKIADSFKEFGLRIMGGSEDIDNFLASAGINMNDLYNGLKDGSITVADAYDLIIPKLQAMDDPINQNAAGVALFGTQWEDLGASAVLGVSLSATSLADMAGATDSLNTKYDSLGAMGETLWRRFQVALIPLGAEMLNLANMVMPHVVTVFSWFEGVLPGWLEMGKAAVRGFTTLVTGLFTGELAGSLGGAQSAFATTRDVISQVMSTASALIGSYLGVIFAFWQQNGSSILAFVTSSWNTVASIISTVMAIIAAVVIPIWTTVAGFINTNQATIIAYFTNAWNAISGLITGVLGFIQGLVNATLSIVKGDWEGAWGHIKEASASLVLGMWAVIQGAFENGKLVLTTIGGAIKDMLAQKWDEAKTAVTEKVEGIKTEVAAKFGEMKTAVANLASEFLEAARGVGGAIVDGIANGISAGAGAIADAARGAARSALDAAKAALGIRSPSRVAASQIGLPFNQGIAEGITRNLGVIDQAAARAGTVAVAGTTSVTNNYNLTAQYANGQREGSLRDDVRLMQMLG